MPSVLLSLPFATCLHVFLCLVAFLLFSVAILNGTCNFRSVKRENFCELRAVKLKS